MAGTVSTGRQDLTTVPYADKTTFINPWSIMTLTPENALSPRKPEALSSRADWQVCSRNISVRQTIALSGLPRRLQAEFF